MKVNQEKLDLVVDLMMNQILGECKGFKEDNVENIVDETLDSVEECNTKLLQGGKINEEVVEEEVEDVDEQMAVNAIRLAQDASKAGALRRAAMASKNVSKGAEEYRKAMQIRAASKLH